jgi:hypothetical protein
MPKLLVFAVAAYVVAMFFVTLYFLIALWPPAASAGPGAPPAAIHFPWGDAALGSDVRLILLAAIAGALGAYVHLATSFADYAGNESLTVNWVWWYVLRPFIGMALAEIVYLALRGGLLSAGTASDGAINPYGVAAVAALTGLFSKQATDKLREVFETLFRTQQKVERKDGLPTTTGTATGAAAGGSK